MIKQKGLIEVDPFPFFFFFVAVNSRYACCCFYKLLAVCHCWLDSARFRPALHRSLSVCVCVITPQRARLIKFNRVHPVCGLVKLLFLLERDYTIVYRHETEERREGERKCF